MQERGEGGGRGRGKREGEEGGGRGRGKREGEGRGRGDTLDSAQGKRRVRGGA